MGHVRRYITKVTLGLAALIIAAFPFLNVIPAFADISDSLWVNSGTPTFSVDQTPYTPPISIFNQPCTYHSFNMPIFNQQTGKYETKVDECAVTSEWGTHGGTLLEMPYDSKAAFMQLSNGSGGAFLNRNSPDLIYGVPSSQSIGRFLFMYRDASTLFQKSPGFNQYQYVYTPKRQQPDVRLMNGLNASITVQDVGFSNNGRWMVVQLGSGPLARVDLFSNANNTGNFDYVSFSNSTVRNSTDLTQLAISDDGRYVGLSGNAQGTLKVYDLKDCMNQQPTMVNNIPRVEGCGEKNFGQVLGANGVANQYGNLLNFSYDNTALSMTVTRNGQPALVTLTAAGQNNDQLDYLALGDSFSSGEGDNVGSQYYEPGTDSGKDKCHLSTRSYPFLVAQHLGVASNKFKSVACSGAVMRDVVGDAYPGSSALTTQWYKGQGDRLAGLSDAGIYASKVQALQDFTPGRAAQIDFVAKYKPKVITVGIGGNDVDFAGKLISCAMPTLPVVPGLPPATCDYATDTVSRVHTGGEISDQFFKYKKLYQALHDASPQSKIYAVGYPIFTASNGAACDSNAQFNTQELTFIREGVKYLNRVMSDAAASAGVGYLSVQDSLAGFELCSGAQANISVNGLKMGDDIAGIIGQESFHPNQRGQSQMADAIEAFTPNILTNNYCSGGATLCPNTSITQPPAVSAYFATGATTLSQLYVQAGNMFSAPGNTFYELGHDASLASSFFEPNSPVKVVVQSTPITLGNFTADANGKLNANVTLPANLPAGPHEMHLMGRTTTGQTIDLYQRIYAIGPEGDRDNNGTPDSQQACVLVAPSGQDVDHDGIDDACDPDLNSAPSDRTPPNVAGTPDRAANANGWYDNDVTINWAATDPSPSSGAPTQPDATTASQEGTHTYTSGQSCDPVGNCATGSLELSIDKTAPEITYDLSSVPTESGWNNSAVTVTFHCSDAISGIDTCTEPQTVSGADGAYVVTGTAIDKADKTTSVNVFVSLDGTAPIVHNTVSPAPNADGWNNTDVTVTPECADNLAGILYCSPAAVLTAEGEGLGFLGVATDNAGNSATAFTAVNIDKTAPVLGAFAWTGNPKATNATAQVSVPFTDNLSGIAEAEYFLGDNDPGQGNGATMHINGANITNTFGTDFPTGVYKVSVRAKDKAGNWSEPVSDYLVVYNPDGVRMTGKKTLLPLASSGDTLSGLLNDTQNDKAKFGFNIRYDQGGNIHPNSDFQFGYSTGTKCGKPAQAQNCHDFDLNATSIAWLTTQGTNNSTGIFQGTASLVIDGVTSNVVFRLTGIDGERLNPTSADHFTLYVYADGANPNTATPLYKVSQDVLRGNIKIRTQ